MFLTIEGLGGAGKTTLFCELKNLMPQIVVVKRKELGLYVSPRIRPQIDLLYRQIWAALSSKEVGVKRDRSLSDILLMAGWFHFVDTHVLQPNLA